MKHCRKLAWLCLLIVTGCETEAPQQAAEIRKAPPVAANDHQDDERVITENTERVIGGLKVVIPAGWEQKSEFDRILEGEFRLTGSAGPARLTLSKARGGKEQNVDRWRGQIKRGPDDAEATETSIEAAGKDATLFEAHGAFTDMFSRNGPQSGWMIFGIVIPIESDYHYFVKVTGPRETVESHREEVLKFVRTARFQN